MTDGLQTWTIYNNPSDYPGKFVVRRMTILGGIHRDPEPAAVVDTLEEARAAVPPSLMRIDRHPNDEPQIVECWL